MSSNSDAVRLSILATVTEIRAGETALVHQGIEVADYEDPEDRAEALDIINRIERRIRANMPAPDDQRPAVQQEVV